jgi:hypothetical protein
MRILTLFVRHGESKYPDALALLEQIADRTLARATRETVVIDNALPPEFTGSTAEGYLLIGGDNSSWEFSGWNKAVRMQGTALWDYDYVHFVTSAFAELTSGHYDHITSALLDTLSAVPAAIGHIDCFNAPVQLYGYVSQHWLRSSYFFIRPAEVRALGSLVSVPDADALFTDNPACPFRDDAAVDVEFQRNVVGWLTGEGTGQGVRWHSRFELKAETLPYFRAKTKAVLNEHLLSARLRALGCSLLDATWLAAHGLSERRPSWREQVRERFASMGDR